MLSGTRKATNQMRAFVIVCGKISQFALGPAWARWWMALPMIMRTPPRGCSTIGALATLLNREGPWRQLVESLSRMTTEARSPLLLLEIGKEKCSCEYSQYVNSYNHNFMLIGSLKCYFTRCVFKFIKSNQIGRSVFKNLCWILSKKIEKKKKVSLTGSSQPAFQKKN